MAQETSTPAVLSRRPHSPLIPHLPPPTTALEAYRNLGLRVEDWLRAREASHQTIAITSAETGSGKTLTSLNLALVIAELSGLRTLLVEGDLLRPTFARYLRIEDDTPGLLECLQEGTAPTEAVLRLEQSRLDVLVGGSGSTSENPLTAQRLRSFVTEVQESYELVLIDCPPLFNSTAYRLASTADGVIVVVSANHTRRRSLAKVLDELQPEKVVGLVFNQDPTTPDTTLGYY